MAQVSSCIFAINCHFSALLCRNISSASGHRLHILARPSCLLPSFVSPLRAPVLQTSSKPRSAPSISSANEAAKAGIPLNDYQDTLQIDFAFDDADVIEEGTLTAIIGRRKLEVDESIIDEKFVIKSASQIAFIIAEKQYTRGLDGSIPVLVNSTNWMDTAEEIDDLFLGDAEVWRRPTSGKAGPLGGEFPMVTKEGHHILDVIFTSPIIDLAKVGENLDQIDGVVDHGVISGIPCTALIAAKSGVLTVDNLS